MNYKKQKINEASKSITMRLNYFFLFFLVILIFSPFVWVWMGWGLFWKLALTGIFGMVITQVIIKTVSASIKQLLNENPDDGGKMFKNKDSNFQQRLNNAITKNKKY